MADQISMLALGVEGYFLSPDEADELESSLSNETWDELTRWKVLGFFYAHQLCCNSKYRTRRVTRIIEMIENYTALDHGCRTFLSLTPADGSTNVSTVRAAWQRRIDLKPEDFAIQDNMAYFLIATNPADAIDYFKRAYQLAPDEKEDEKKLFEKWILTAQKLSEKPPKAVAQEEEEEVTCFFDVISQASKLLEDIRKRRAPTTENWGKFMGEVNMIVRNPTMLPFSQYGLDGPRNAAPEILLRHALKSMHAAIPANNPTGEFLRCEPYKTYWNDLTEPEKK